MGAEKTAVTAAVAVQRTSRTAAPVLARQIANRASPCSANLTNPWDGTGTATRGDYSPKLGSARPQPRPAVCDTKIAC